MVNGRFAAPVGAALLLPASMAPGGAAVVSGGAGADAVSSLNPDFPADWLVTEVTLPSPVATGGFDIRTACRVNLCGADFTVYLLQSIRDRRQVYECTSDDTYRPVVPIRASMSMPPSAEE